MRRQDATQQAFDVPGDGATLDSQFHSALETLPAAAYTCDCNGLIIYFNSAAERLWGRSPRLNDPVDRFCGSFKLFSPDGSPIAHDDCWMALALKSGRSFVGQEIVIERPDGRRLAVLAHASPLRNAAGDLVGAVNILVDLSDRRRSDEALARLAAIIESSSDAIISKTLNGEITSWNAGAERLFGYTASEVIGRPDILLIPPERQDEERFILERIRSGERVEHYETIRLTKGGSRIDISLTISPIRNSSGVIVGASKVARDITSQKRIAKALQESELRFAKFMQYFPGAAWIKDYDGRYVFINGAGERAYQKTSAELCGKRDAEIFSAEVAARFAEGDRQVLSSGDNGEKIDLLEHVDGLHQSVVSKFPIPGSDGEPNMVGGIAIDITERKKAEEALGTVKDELAEQLEDLRRLHDMSVQLSSTFELPPIMAEALQTAITFEKAELGLLALCDPERNELQIGASVGIDQWYLDKIKSTPLGDGVCGACCRERRRIVVEDIETDPLYATYREAARQAGIRSVHSTPLITRSGKVLGVLSTYSRRPYRPSDRTIRLIDLCARQAADFIDNARLYSELRETDRRKDEFLATLAHELRNPLAPICNSLHLLRLSDDLTPAVQHVREIMERQVNHMVRLVDDLLEVARITQGKIDIRREFIELSAVIGSAVETSRPLIEAAEHQLAITFSSEPLMVEADPMRVSQVIANLLNNAAKYTPKGGQIWLTARREHSEAVISVRDNGQGIPEDMLPRVFDMFAQVERHAMAAKSGLGIGLALAKSLIHLHGGRIEAFSKGAGSGSEFIIHLPLAPVAAEIAMPAKVIAGRTASTRRILVVDDTPSSAYVLGKLLETMDQQVVTTEDASSALRLAAKFRPHVVFSDIAMPQMDGYELARRLRREPELASVVLVALTGYGHEEDRQRAYEAGFDHYLVKPVSVEVLDGLLGLLPAPPELAAPLQVHTA